MDYQPAAAEIRTYSSVQSQVHARPDAASSPHTARFCFCSIPTQTVSAEAVSPSCPVTVAASTAPAWCFSWSSQIPPRGEQTRPRPACSPAIGSGSAVPPGDGQILRSGSFHTCHTPSRNIPDGTAKLSPITTQHPSPLRLLHPHKPAETLYV